MPVAVREKLDEIQAAYGLKLAEFEALGRELSDGGIGDNERAALLAEFDKVAEKYHYEVKVHETIRVDTETNLASTKKVLARVELDLKTTAVEEAEEVAIDI